jgi:perosamine synthetase
MRQIPFGRPMIGEEERAAVLEVLSGPILVHGPRATQFESDFAAYTGAPHAVSVSSCTAGMHLVYFALGLGPGDEVIVPAQTHAATAHTVELTGAKPVFVDAEAETGNIDIAAIERAATARTKAIAVVHFLGMPVDMAAVVSLAKPRGWFVLEDCALALGTRLDGVHAGLFGDVGVFSFYPVKHITTAEGGMIITRDEKLAQALRLKKAFGVNRSHGERAVPGVYDVDALGFNYRMSELHAAVGIAQMKKIDGFLARRKANYRTLAAAIEGIPGLRLLRSSGGRFESSYYCLSVVLDRPLIERRLEIVERLKGEGIGTSVYYPHAVPHLAYYRRKYGYGEDSFPVAASISNGSIALPVGPHLGEEDMRIIGGALRRAMEGIAS